MDVHSHRSSRVALGLALLATFSGTARADEVRVLAAGAAKAALEQIAPQFQRATGHSVRAGYDTVGAQRDRVLKGEAADLVILSDSAIAQLAAAGRLPDAGRQPIGIVAVSLAVRAGAAACAKRCSPGCTCCRSAST